MDEFHTGILFGAALVASIWGFRKLFDLSNEWGGICGYHRCKRKQYRKQGHAFCRLCGRTMD